MGTDGAISTHRGSLIRAALASVVLIAAPGCRSVLPVFPGNDDRESAGGPAAGPTGEREQLRTVHDRLPHPSRSDGLHRGGGDDSSDLTVAVVSDMNGSYGSTDYNRRVHGAVDWITGRLQPDLVLSTGDHVAGQRRGLDYEAMWEAFQRVVTRPLDRADIPFAPTPGNHDASALDAYDEERDRYVREWRERRPAVDFVGTGNYPLYYAFELDSVLFVSLDATISGPLPDEQMDWLRTLLRDRSPDQTTIVYSHLPIAPFSADRTDEIIGDRDLVQLLADHDVDAVLSGHHHAYYPGRTEGLTVIGLSCLGAGPRRLLGTETTSRKSSVVLRISPEGGVTVGARWGPSMRKRVDRSDLPRALRHDDWTIRRLGTADRE